MLLKRLYNSFVAHKWELALISNPISDIINGNQLSFHYIINPFEDRWFADPFILSVDDDVIVLLVEDYRYSDNMGRISRLDVDRNSLQILKVIEILQIDTHLSFPAILRIDDKVFIYPESSHANGLWMYNYNPKTNVCQKVYQLCSLPLTDAIITDRFGKKLLFSTREPNPNKNRLDIYEWDDVGNEFVKSASVFFEENIARNAGDFFEFNGECYRPAQECNKMYGHAISVQKVERFRGIFKLTDVRRILPPKSSFGIHTLNTYQGITIVDLKEFRYPWLGKPLFYLRNHIPITI